MPTSLVNRRHALIASGLVAVLVIVGLVNHARNGRLQRIGPPAPTTSAAPNPFQRSSISLSGGAPIALAGGGQLVYALAVDPPRLIRIDPNLPVAFAGSVPVPNGSRYLAFDSVTRRLWVVGGGDRSSTVTEFDALSLATKVQVQVPMMITAVTTENGRLWLGTPNGLHSLPFGGRVPAAVRAVPGNVVAVAADPVRDRILVALDGSSGTDLVAVRDQGGEVDARGSTSLVRPTFAVVANDIWLGGYLGGGADDRTLQHLNPATLVAGVTGSGPVGDTVGPSAAVFPGVTVVWALNENAHSVTCINAATGRVQGGWSDIAGGVVSRPGFAFGLNGQQIVGLRLTESACYQG
ncbi:MAG: hypothetical protein JWN95_3239 [Frankiales bacterium]|nr:hypothetical protein [Frankiales bacterium]